jgi:hypothetical protein
MSDVQVYRGGARAATVERLSQPGTSLARADIEAQFKIATAIANATEAVPRSYRKQPGAVLLALAWAQQHDLDVLTTIQGVTFIEGRAVVDATMQRALAKRAGYELGIEVEADYAAVQVKQGGEVLGFATYSMADAERAGLLGKKNWQHNPEDMLVARATTRAVRRFAPDVLLGMAVSDDLDEDAPTPPEQPPAVAAAFPPPFAAEHGLDAAEPVTAPVDDAGADAPAADPPRGTEASAEVPPSAEVGRTWSSVSALRRELRDRGISERDAVMTAQAIAEELGEPTPGSMVNVLDKASDELRARFTAWVRGHGLGA